MSHNPLPLAELSAVDPQHEEALAPFHERLTDTAGTLFKEELLESGHRVERLAAVTIAGVTQGLERARIAAFVLPQVFDEVLEHGIKNGWNGYQIAGAAGLSIAGLWGGWTEGVGKAFQWASNVLPKTTKKIVENHPIAVGVIAKAIDGFPSNHELRRQQPIRPAEGYDVGPYDTRKTVLGKIALAVSRGLKTGFMFGSTPHVGVASVNGHSEKSTTKRRHAVTAESSVMFGSVAVGVSTLVTHNSLGLAQDVRDVVANEKLWAGISVGLIGYTALANFISRKSFQRQQAKLQLDKPD